MLSQTVADRLEQVRELAGFESLQDFRKKLLGKKYAVSYTAARNYHMGRDAPVSYLGRVAEVFPNLCTLEWLATGKGPRSGVERRARQEAESQVETWLNGTANLGWIFSTEASRVRFLDVFTRWHEQNEQRATLLGTPLPTPEESFQEFAALLSAPVMRWHHLHPAGGLAMHPDRIAAYVDAILLAVWLSTPDGRDFDFARPLHAENTNA